MTVLSERWKKVGRYGAGDALEWSEVPRSTQGTKFFDESTFEDLTDVKSVNEFMKRYGSISWTHAWIVYIEAALLKRAQSLNSAEF